MAFATTTLSSACALTDTNLVVASATSFAAGRFVIIDQELMQVANSYVSGTTIPVRRGLDGTATAAHVVTSNVTHGLATDFAAPGVGNETTYPPAGRTIAVQSITATSTLTLPPAGTDLRVILNGTSVITLTVPVPTKDMDGTILYIASNGAAAHVVTFTSTLNNAGAGYTSFTNNSTGRLALIVIAVNGFWSCFSGPAWTGTVTNVVGGIA